MKKSWFFLLFWSVLALTYLLQRSTPYLTAEMMLALKRSHLINVLIATTVIVGFIPASKRQNPAMTLIFFSGSLLKLTFYFVWIYPLFRVDGLTSRMEFSLFFIPFFLALFFSNGLHDFTAEKKLEVFFRAGPVYQLATGRNFFVKTLGKSS
ncbi:MAG: hypothetical protein ACO3M9_07155 [Flavobacteriaceae bacterium]